MNEIALLRLLMLRVTYAMPFVTIERREVINRAVTIDGRKVHLKIGIKGQSDAFAQVDGGGHIELEAKAAGGKMSEAQERWQACCRKKRRPHLLIEARKDEEPEATVARWIEEIRPEAERLFRLLSEDR